ncbi:hybrid sensor histidine kinase/response regulator transcription factor [Reichenbachiella versicolor]|uniref:hybrid sensor histidine kinase/response regulator transcription factor n=1 Tax=Reichenbachiella versicolor TaxID=1821036 RepID=UPI000D6DFF71|nr:two-component regulator propeller domain-containing protein [Reichenbachiella versicolor]
MMRRLIYCLLFLTHLTSAQNLSEYDNFIAYTTRDGLSQNDVKSIVQDHDGYIWVGTNHGLNRFDGFTFKQYINDPKDSTSIGGDLIMDLVVTSSGVLWVASSDKVLSKYDRFTDSFVNYNHETVAPLTIINKGVKCMLIDKENNVWAGGMDGIDKLIFNSAGELLDIINYPINDFNGSAVMTIYQDKYDGIWVGSKKGLFRFIGDSRSKGQFMKIVDENLGVVEDIDDYQNGLLISAKGVHFVTHKSLNSGNPVFTMVSPMYSRETIISQDGRVWGANRNNGLSVQKIDVTKKQKPFKFKTKPSNPKSINSESPFSLYEDRSGLIWIGSKGGGLSKYNPKTTFKHFKKTSNERAITSNVIRSVFEDSQNNLWMGSESKGANVLPARAGKKYHNGWYNINQIDIFKKTHFLTSINEAILGNKKYIVLGGGYKVNLNLIRIDGRKPEQYEQRYIKQPELAVFCIEASKNQIWAGTYSGGLYRYLFNDDGKPVSITNFNIEQHESSGLLSNIIRSLKFDQDMNLWIGTDKGLNKIPKEDLKTNLPRFIQYTNDPKDPYSISKDYILPIYVTSNNDVWVGTLGGGLNRVFKGENVDEDKFVRYGMEDGLPSEVIKAILEDDDGNLWISSNNGISKFDPENLYVTNYGLSEGLQDLEFGEMAAWRRRSGEMIFGGVNGFNAFFPEKVRTDTVPPSVSFDNLLIDNHPIKVGEKLNGKVILVKQLNHVDQIELEHHQNSFSLEMAALHFVAPKQNTYKYKLEGFDKEWITTNVKNRTIRYTNLPHGEYKLMVKAGNSDGVWSEAKTIKFIIQTPPWLTIWAYIFYVVLFIVIFYVSRRFTLITISSKNELVLQKKNEEVHQMKLKFFTNISHEFRTPLTLILGYSEKLDNSSDEISDEEKKKYYQNILRNSKSLLNLINQLLGFRKAEQGMMKLRVSMGSITSYIEQLSGNFQNLANQKDIDLKVTYSQSIEMWFDREVIERVIFNLLSNAFKFTADGGKIDVIIDKKKTELYIVVADNGDGIPEEQRDKIFERFNTLDHTGKSGSGIGLSFVQSLVSLHKGTIELEGKRKEGTAFIITLPIEKSAYQAEQVLEVEDLKEDNSNVDWLIPEEHVSIHDSEEDREKDHSVLVVEDNEEIRQFIKDSFSQNYNIYEAADGSEGLKICQEETIDIVITDVMMDGMNGIEFCKKLKADDRISHIPVIILTAKDTEDDKLTGYHVGAEAYVTKPFRVEELEARLKAILHTRVKIIEKYRSKVDMEPAEIGLTNSDQKFLDRLMKNIEANISNSEFAIEELAMECGLSQHHLNKKMKALVGSTAKAFVRKMRLKRAAQLFTRKDITSVTQVMNEVGFNDPKYFRLCFKEEFGIPPKEYQMQQQNRKE